jgi:menaquinone-dependent protoporphyrinogen IX oxidase
MSGLVIYYSRYGSTQEYAEALAKSMKWEVLSYKNVTAKALKDAESVVLASNVRIGKMGITKFAKRYIKLISSKCKAVIAVGGSERDKQDYYLDIVKKNLFFLGLKNEQIFGLGGRQKLAEMKGMDSLMFKMMDKMMKDSPGKTEMMKEVDHVDIQHIEPIVAYLKK